MASKRCGCASDICSCVIEAGAGVAISGTGSKNNPYTIDAIPNATDLSVQDENTVIRTGVTLLDFKGGGVTATAGDTGEVIVTVPAPPAPGIAGLTVSQQVFTTTGASTWTKPANTVWVEVEVQGAGGGGGGCALTAAAQAAAGAGGGGGGYARKVFNASALGATEPVTVGAGGGGGTAGANAGSTGGNSTFGTGAYLITGTGGTGGAGGTSVASGAVAGGDGGAATGGDLNVTGGDALNARVVGTTAPTPLTFGGGVSTLGNPQRPTVTTTGVAGVVGQQYGSGGVGAVNFASQAGALAGGAGAQGIVVVTSYVKTVATVLSETLSAPVAAGRVTIPLSNTSIASAAVTFPSGRFTEVPVVVATVNTGNTFLLAQAQNPTTDGVLLVVFHRDAANVSVDVSASWVARAIG